MLERRVALNVKVDILEQYVWLTMDHCLLHSWCTRTVFNFFFMKFKATYLNFLLFIDHIVFARNNVFYKNLHEKALDIFGPSIHTLLNAQNEKLKYDLMNHMVSLFGDTFNKKCVIKVVGLNLKYVRHNYREKI